MQFRFTNANRGTDGQNPDCTLTPGLTGDSALYGTTYSGGSADSGTVFSVTPGSGDGSGTFKLLHTFGDGSVANDGANPDRGRMQPDSTGDFFSTTLYGGDSGNGTVWELTPTGTETILHSFEGDGDGANPEGTMTLASDGNYYGDTINDGAFGDGEVYTISKTGTFRRRLRFRHRRRRIRWRKPLLRTGGRQQRRLGRHHLLRRRFQRRRSASSIRSPPDCLIR